MSLTTTANPITYAATRALVDYDLHHSEEIDESGVSAEPNAHPAPEGTGEPVEGWETEWRRIPPHRPINHELDFAFRDVYSNNVERFFLFNMFNGIRMQSFLNRTWRATGGKINDRIFRWQVGGEW